MLVAMVALPQAPPEPITVAAAVSLTDVLEEAAKAYAAAGGGPVRFNLAGSNVLARQIVHGAPADVFISADEAQMEVVEKAGAILAGSRFDLVGNQLAVAAVPEKAALVRQEFARAPAEIRRLAIGDPAAVPAGVYAKRYLEQKHLWSAYESRIVPTTNVRAALTAVETGSVDAAIVYLTDLAAGGSAVLATLSRRGLGRAERAELDKVVRAAQLAPGLRPGMEAPGRSPRESELLALYRWYGDWAATARAVVRRRDYLIAMGLAERARAGAE